MADYKFSLDLDPGISVGPLKFGTDREEICKIIKKEYGCDREILEEYRDFYESLDLLLDFNDNKLERAQFIADPHNKACEIKFNGEKIWPRTRKKFFSIFEKYNFAVFFECYTNADLDIGAQWVDNPPTFAASEKGYGATWIETMRLTKVTLSLKKGMKRSEIRSLIKLEPTISDDGCTDIFHDDKYLTTYIHLTYNTDGILVSGFEHFPDDKKIDIV